ncbi:MAG TPA: glycosyltransferase, partial [Candidatus Nanoarchaeia archaeon]|nr:glycosyltransferase [Candidatus Nanoarchaeia archaeon]
MNSLKIAMLAPPWLKTPPEGYGGTESVVHNLCRGLQELGVHVELFSIKGSSSPANSYHWLFEDEQYQHIHAPMYNTAAIPTAHLLRSLELIRRDGNFDLIHDHNHILGPAMLAERKDLPPVLHTLHGPFANDERIEQGIVDDNPYYITVTARAKRIFYNGISRAQLKEAPWAMRKQTLGAVHHGIDPAEHKFYPKKDDYFVNVGRIAREKGINIAAEICQQNDWKFKIAGLVADIDKPAKLRGELAQSGSRYHSMTDFIYFRDHVAPYMTTGQIAYIGSIFGKAKDELIGRAKAFLMPIQWEEPFGVAVIDALVCGTPVVAMRRGS